MNLRRLGFSSTGYSEVILSIRLGGKTNAAPMGVTLRGNSLLLKVYRGSTTYKMLTGGARDCVLNITCDPKFFYYALLEKDNLRYSASKAVMSPRIIGCDGYVECVIGEILQRKGWIQVYLDPVLATARKKIARVYSRAGPALIEAMVYMTKLDAEGLERKDAEEAFLRVRLSVETVYRTTRNRRYREMADRVLEEAEKKLRRRSN